MAFKGEDRELFQSGRGSLKPFGEQLLMGGGKVSEGKREKELEESGAIDSDRKSPKMPPEYQAITTRHMTHLLPNTRE